MARARDQKHAVGARGRHRDRQGCRPAVDLNQKHAIMGPNGSGSRRSPRADGPPAYEITEAQILLDRRRRGGAGGDERARRGLILAFQYPTRFPE